MRPHIEAIKPTAIPRTYKSGANLLFQGEVPRRGMLLTDGVARAYTIASSGEERTIGFYTRGDILPLSWLLDQVTNSLFYYEALTDVRLVHFSKNDFENTVLNNPVALKSLFLDISRESTTKVLRNLQKKSVITYAHGIYTVDKDKLESYVGEDAFRDLRLR